MRVLILWILCVSSVNVFQWWNISECQQYELWWATGHVESRFRCGCGGWGGFGALCVTTCQLAGDNVYKSASLCLSVSSACCPLSPDLQTVHVGPRLAGGHPELHEGSAVSFGLKDSCQTEVHLSGDISLSRGTAKQQWRLALKNPFVLNISIRYNHTGTQFFEIKKSRPLCG